MLRVRRYRAHLVFAVIALLALIHFSGIREWGASSPSPPPPPKTAGYKPNKPQSGSGTNDPDEKQDEKVVQNTHGFAPQRPTAAEPAPAPSAHATLLNANNDKPSQNKDGKDGGNAKPKQPAVTPVPLPQIPIVQDEQEFDGYGFEPVGQGRLEVDEDLPRTPVRWEKQPEHFPVASKNIIPLPTGEPKTTSIPKIQAEFAAETETQKRERVKKLSVVKESFLHAWNGYKKHAMGHDEVDPVHGDRRNPFMGWGATLVDTLDTLWIMGMKEEFEEAVEATKKIDFGTSARKDIPLFETVIRYLGGLIGAYDVSGAKYPVLLDKAKELAEILMGAFDTPNRMPDMYYHWAP